MQIAADSQKGALEGSSAPHLSPEELELREECQMFSRCGFRSYLEIFSEKMLVIACVRFYCGVSDLQWGSSLGTYFFISTTVQSSNWSTADCFSSHLVFKKFAFDKNRFYFNSSRWLLTLNRFRSSRRETDLFSPFHKIRISRLQLKSFSRVDEKSGFSDFYCNFQI